MYNLIVIRWCWQLPINLFFLRPRLFLLRHLLCSPFRWNPKWNIRLLAEIWYFDSAFLCMCVCVWVAFATVFGIAKLVIYSRIGVCKAEQSKTEPIYRVVEKERRSGGRSTRDGKCFVMQKSNSECQTNDVKNVFVYFVQLWQNRAAASVSIV